MSKIIRTFVMLVVKSETGWGKDNPLGV